MRTMARTVFWSLDGTLATSGMGLSDIEPGTKSPRRPWVCIAAADLCRFRAQATGLAPWVRSLPLPTQEPMGLGRVLRLARNLRFGSTSPRPHLRACVLCHPDGSGRLNLAHSGAHPMAPWA
jgi:hypothetical protein